MSQPRHNERWTKTNFTSARTLTSIPMNKQLSSLACAILVAYGPRAVAGGAKESPQSRAEVRDDGRFYVDGKPFFVIGMYCVEDKDFPLLARAGFNAVHTYMFEHMDVTTDDQRRYLDAAHENGLKVLVGLPRQLTKDMQPELVIQRLVIRT